MDSVTDILAAMSGGGQIVPTTGMAVPDVVKRGGLWIILYGRYRSALIIAGEGWRSELSALERRNARRLYQLPRQPQ